MEHPLAIAYTHAIHLQSFFVIYSTTFYSFMSYFPFFINYSLTYEHLIVHFIPHPSTISSMVIAAEKHTIKFTVNFFLSWNFGSTSARCCIALIFNFSLSTTQIYNSHLLDQIQDNLLIYIQ
jgi:hypothetical protein